MQESYIKYCRLQNMHGNCHFPSSLYFYNTSTTTNDLLNYNKKDQHSNHYVCSLWCIVLFNQVEYCVRNVANECTRIGSTVNPNRLKLKVIIIHIIGEHCTINGKFKQNYWKVQFNQFSILIVNISIFLIRLIFGYNCIFFGGGGRVKPYLLLAYFVHKKR